MNMGHGMSPQGASGKGQKFFSEDTSGDKALQDQRRSSTQSFDTRIQDDILQSLSQQQPQQSQQQQLSSSTPCSSSQQLGYDHVFSKSQKEFGESENSFLKNNLYEEEIFAFESGSVQGSSQYTHAGVSSSSRYGGGLAPHVPSGKDLATSPPSSSQDRESRTVLIQGIDPNTPDNILKEQFECFGDIQSISLETKMQGYMMITYHDIRAARLAMHSSGTVWRGRQLSCTMLGQDVTVQSSSPTMLYLISLDGGKSLDDVYYLLSSYGELKDLKQHPYQQHCCMAEFYDSRHAAAALSSLKSSPDVTGRLVVLDGSNKDLFGNVEDFNQQQQYVNRYQQTYSTSVSDMTKNLSEISLDSNRSPHQSSQGLYQMMPRGLVQSNDMLNRRTSTYPSAEKMWQANAMVDRHGASPPSTNAQWLASNEVLAALQAQQMASMQSHHLHHQNQSSMQSVLQGAFLSNPDIGRSQYVGGSQSMQQPTRRNVSDPSLGGRLARRNVNPLAEAERKAQQDRLYGLDLHKILAGEDRRTTLMIKNIPNKYTQKMLLTLLEERFAGTHPFPFDFFYLPIDFKNKCNVGYAFINMTTHLAIPALVEDFHGRRWPKFNSEKVCQIAYGRIQGKLALIQHFQNSSLLHEDKRCRPVLFNIDGEVEQFPIGPEALASFSMKHQKESGIGRGEAAR